MKNKIIIILLILVIAVGTAIICTNGFNLGIEYGSSKKINVVFKENFELSDIENIVKEVLGNEDSYKVDYIDEFKASVSITAKSITDEQIENLENKLKEKYKTLENKKEASSDEENSEEETEESIIIVNMPSVKAYDLIKIYIKPMIIVTAVSVVFLGIMNRKQGLLRAFGMPIIIICGALALYMSAVAILRIPLNEYVINIGVLVYMISLIASAVYTKCDNGKE